jgi:hypothetical protein
MNDYSSKAYPWGAAVVAGLALIASVIGAINESEPKVILIGLAAAAGIMLAYRINRQGS